MSDRITNSVETWMLLFSNTEEVLELLCLRLIKECISEVRIYDIIQ